MADERQPHDQFGKNADATAGGGASADRGGRDAGMPGPAPGSATGGSKRHADPTETDAARTENSGTAPVQSADE